MSLINITFLGWHIDGYKLPIIYRLLEHIELELHFDLQEAATCCMHVVWPSATLWILFTVRSLPLVA